MFPNYCHLVRKIVLMIIMFCPLYVFSQKDYSNEIIEILENKDHIAGQKLLKKITPEDVSILDDRGLLYYYYLKAFVERRYDKEAAIKDYLAIKNLIETKVGIFNETTIYIDIINNLGLLSERCGKEAEALLYYEEGIVKSLAFFDTGDETLQDIIRSLRNNAAAIYKKQGHEKMANYLELEKPLEYGGTRTQIDEMLAQAIQSRDKGEVEKAIELLDKAKEILVKREGKDVEMMQTMYRTYLYCYASKGDINNIDILLETKKRDMFYDGIKSHLASDMEEVISTFILTHHDIKAATKYYNFLSREYDKSNSDDVEKVKKCKDLLSFFKREYFVIDSLAQKRDSYIEKNYEWGGTSLLLANEYNLIRNYSTAYNICMEIYSVSSKFVDDPRGLHIAVLQNLADYNMLDGQDLKLAERYLTEQLNEYDKLKIPLNSEYRGWVYNKLAVVYMKTGQYKMGDEAVIKAENILVPVYTKESEVYTIILHNKGRLAQLQGKLKLAQELLMQSNDLRIKIVGSPLERTMQYLKEVEQAIKGSL